MQFAFVYLRYDLIVFGESLNVYLLILSDPVFFRQVFSRSSSATPECLKFYANTWLDLIVSSSFYAVWRPKLVAQIPSVKVSDQPAPQLTEAMIEILTNSLGLISKVESSELKFSIDSNFKKWKPTFQSRTELNGMDVALRILEKFTETFCDNCIPPPKDESVEFRAIPHYVFPIVAGRIPWLSWITFLQVEHCDRFASASSQARHLLYSILCLTPKETIWKYPREFFTPVSKLMHSVDPM